jgi:hypothetical protein
MEDLKWIAIVVVLGAIALLYVGLLGEPDEEQGS